MGWRPRALWVADAGEKREGPFVSQENLRSASALLEYHRSRPLQLVEKISENLNNIFLPPLANVWQLSSLKISLKILMDTEAPVLQRPRRASKRPPLADDFIDNIDIEIEAIESLPPTTVRPALAAPHPEDGPRKRGRPRKYPLAPPPLPDVQPVKRPRGRPKGKFVLRSRPVIALAPKPQFLAEL